LRHIGEHLRLGLRRAAGDDDAQRGPFALEPADRLPRLRDRLIGDRAAVDDDGVIESGALGLCAQNLGLEGVEAAAKGDDVNAHATDANNAGSNWPSYSKAAGPVIRTWSSRLRHSIVRSPPGKVICTVRSVRFSRAAATAVAQAAEPQALVSPAPRSQVRIVTWSRSTIWASVMLARSGKIGWFSSNGPKRRRSWALTSSTQKIACGLPMLTTEGECRLG